MDDRELLEQINAKLDVLGIWGCAGKKERWEDTVNYRLNENKKEE